jgi:sialic acid synthase SpsE
MKIGSVDLDHDVLVVAEIGNNHEGNFEVARELVRQAATCGVHAVKFQTFRTELFVNPRDQARYERLKSFELTHAQFAELGQLARSLGLLFLSTPLDIESARFLAGHVDAFKIASGDNNFYPLLSAVCSSEKPIIVSTGLSDMAQIKSTKLHIEREWTKQGLTPGLAFLHCVTSYPAPSSELNLAAIPMLAESLQCPVGYSDHTLDLEACAAAVALGACIIEKHFTLDKRFSSFRDHQLSADPAELGALVKLVKRVKSMRGYPVKTIQPCEQSLVTAARRSIVAAHDLPAGDVMTIDDILWLRPAVGLAPGEEYLILHKRLRKAISAGEIINTSDTSTSL